MFSILFMVFEFSIKVLYNYRTNYGSKMGQKNDLFLKEAQIVIPNQNQ